MAKRWVVWVRTNHIRNSGPWEPVDRDFHCQSDAILWIHEQFGQHENLSAVVMPLGIHPDQAQLERERPDE